MKIKKKVAFIVTALNSGGIENYLLRFLIFESEKIDATVYCRANFIGDLEMEYKNANINVIPFKLGYFNVFEYFSFYRELKLRDFDTVVDFCGNISGLSLLTSKFAGISKRIVFYRNSSDRFKRDLFRNFYDKIMHHLVRSCSTSILANSRAGLEFYHPDYSRLGTKCEVIYNGIDAAKFTVDKKNLRSELKISDSDFVIGHVGRYNSAKNHETIIEVANILCQKYPNITFLLCGADVDSKLNEEIVQLGLSTRIKLLGHKNNVIQVLNSLDCFYFPSLTEGQPNALIEAMVVGLPFVASDIPPIKETVHSDYHDYLVPPKSVDQAVNKLESLFLSSNRFNAKEWASNHFRPSFWFNKFFDKL